MKKLILLSILFISILAANASSFRVASYIPFGDKARVNRTVPTYGVETTVLSVASGGAVVTGLKIECPNQYSSDALSSLELDNVKVTVDGASERTLTYDAHVCAGQRISNVGLMQTNWADVGLRVAAEDSLTIKINTTATNYSATNGVVMVEYSAL